MTSLKHQDSIVIHASPDEVYELVSDVTRTGEWSPICQSCWWHEGESARVGAHFTGRNESNGRTWETVSEVVAAERARKFAWIVGDDYVRWEYTIDPLDGDTELTESWEFTPAGQDFMYERFGKKLRP